jgi:AraC-like DNA-binding protein
MEGVLVPFAAALARTIHRNFHARFSSPDSVITQPSLRPLRDRNGRLLILESVFRWACEYQEQFTTAHNTPPQRVRRLLEASQGSAGELADTVGVGRRTLERQFRQEIGTSIRKYRTRERLSGAIRRLHGTSECVEAVALGAGWKSKKGFYDALSGATGRTPGDVREMSGAEVDGLISQLRAVA